MMVGESYHHNSKRRPKIQKKTWSLIPFTSCSKISTTKLHNSGMHTNLEKLPKKQENYYYESKNC